MAKTFISRTDVKARQISSIAYAPVFEPWTRSDISEHLMGTKTYGHYLVSKENEAKVFCFDIDIRNGGGYNPTLSLEAAAEDEEGWKRSFQLQENLRKAWLDRRDPGRNWVKYQLKVMGLELMRAIYENLEVKTAMAYSGSKGIHVYGLLGKMPAVDVREGALLALELTENWKLCKGHSTFEHVNQDPITGFPNFELEVYPKQNSLEGKELGNLLRLPLGKNRKALDNPTFFIDPRSAVAQWVPADPVWALTTENPWEA